MGEFGAYIRQKREQLQKLHPGKFSVRKVAAAIDIESSYLSKIERGIEAPPGEGTIIAIATELDEDADVLLAMAGKVSGDLQKIIRHRPQLFAEVIRQMKDMPDHAIVRVVREVRDGNW